MLRRMNYDDFLKEQSASPCFFCGFPSEPFVDENEYCYVVLARAPYTADHLLVVPKDHVIFLNELSSAQLDAAMALITKWTAKLHETYPWLTLLLRDGLTGWELGKSVNHLHFHLIPKVAVTAIGNRDDREYFDDEIFSLKTEEFKEKFKIGN